jgi:hypothetical protein
VTRRRLPRAVLATGVVLLAFVRPWAHGIPPAGVALFWAFVLVHVLLPGMALCWATQRSRPDLALLAGQGCSLGLVVQALGCFGARASGMPAVAPLTSVAVVAASLLIARRRLADAPPRDPARPDALLLLALLLLACSLQPLFSERHLGSPIPVDLLFHSGNAGEVRHRWPLETPRISGMPLKYQLFAYALPAGAASWSALPVADVLLTLAPLFWMGLVVLQSYNAGRALFQDGRVGLLGAGMVVCHADPGRVLGLGAGAFNSFFSTGLYGSPTTVCGFILLASLAVTLCEWLVEEPGRATLVPLALLSLASSAAKASVLPTVAGGLLLLSLWACFRRRGLVRPSLVALTVVALAGTPVTLWLSTGEGTYHGMLRFGLGAAMRHSEYARWLGRVAGLGALPRTGLALVGALPWLIGYLGLVGVGFLAWIAGRPRPTPSQVWALGVAGTGAALGLCLEAHGLSQLFFFYSGQVMLALFAGAGILGAFHTRRPLVAAAVLAASLPSLLFATTGTLGAYREDRLAYRIQPTQAESQYAAGLRWLRAHAAEGSVVFADNSSLYLTAFGECRLFYESGLYSPQNDLLWGASADQAYAEKIALQERLLRQPDRKVVAEAQARLPPGVTLRIVADSVQTRIDGGIETAQIGPVAGRVLFPRDLFELEFANAAMHVYRASPGTAPAGDLPSNRGTP